LKTQENTELEGEYWGGHDPPVGWSAISDRITGKQLIVMSCMSHQKKAPNMSWIV